MKSKIKLLAILLIAVFGTFSPPIRTLSETARSTYVEGLITQDTIWTLVDSPFVVSNNVTICPEVRLTIEPDVEVRFGGDFSLIVEGIVAANGRKDRMIRFTSNSLTPEAGDWGTIIFNGTQLSSLTHCIIDYGTNGIVVENGSLEIRESSMKCNSQNGITMNNGSLIVKNSEIANNTVSGIYIVGGDLVDVQNNTMEGNGNGVTLTGNSTCVINISQNTILLSEQSGILLEAETYENTAILNNKLLENNNGFCVSANTSTLITRNYISKNQIGIYYEGGYNHEAHHNDIYENHLGIDTSGSVTVNATYNYWGHRTGPFHESLNPHGKGNTVGGDGVNLDFMFFLSAPIDYENTPPEAVLWMDKTLVAPDQSVTFIGTDSRDDGRIDQYLFDFGDQTATDWTTLSLFDHAYTSVGTYSAILVVRDDFDATSVNIATKTIRVEALPPLRVAITLSNETVTYDKEVSVGVYVSNEIGAVENANVTLFSVRGGNFNPVSGVTDSTGHFTATFTAPDATEITDVRIIATASKFRYADGSDYKYLKVIPPLQVQASAESLVIKSEASTAIIVNVTVASGFPIENAALVLASDCGNLSATSGFTDLNGFAVFNFTAPQTLSQINATIAIIATKLGYADGLSQTMITVEPRILAADVVVDPPAVISEETSNITVYVTSDGNPFNNATIEFSSDIGEISPATMLSDENGKATVVFNAPQVTIREGAIANITLRASKNGYVSAEGQVSIPIVSKMLAVDIAATPSDITSNSQVNVTVHVFHESDMTPAAQATVIPVSNYNLSFLPPFGLTDANGSITFSFATPEVNEQTNISIVVLVSKTGYVDEETSLNLTFSPGTLDAQVTVASSEIFSNGTSTIDVYVTSNSNPIANASITVSADDGSLSFVTGVTGTDGRCTFYFTAPVTVVQMSIGIGANVSRNGYISAQSQTTLDVIPEAATDTGGGWSIAIILLILIPVAIVAILAVLIRQKILLISFREEGKE